VQRRLLAALLGAWVQPGPRNPPPSPLGVCLCTHGYVCVSAGTNRRGAGCGAASRTSVGRGALVWEPRPLAPPCRLVWLGWVVAATACEPPVVLGWLVFQQGDGCLHPPPVLAVAKQWGPHWVGWPSWVATLLLAKLEFADKCRGQRALWPPRGLVPVEPPPHYQAQGTTTTTPSPPPHNLFYFKPNTCCCCWLHRGIAPRVLRCAVVHPGVRPPPRWHVNSAHQHGGLAQTITKHSSLAT
jgi:hypothetical protein